MKIFISWSGETSRKIAGLIKEFIPKIIQSAKPYYTPDDIDKGMKWETDIYKQLETCSIGLICLTKDNTDKPWILFEAGALSNRLKKAKVCPILFGVKKTDIAGPLTTFQMTEFTKDDFLKLIMSINNSLDEPVDETNIKEIFEAFFSKLDTDISEILKQNKNQTSKSQVPTRSERDILEEILLLVRRQERRINLLERNKMDEQVSFNVEDTLSDGDFTVGDIVYHGKYGKGKVLEVLSRYLLVEFRQEDASPLRKMLPRHVLELR